MTEAAYTDHFVVVLDDEDFVRKVQKSILKKIGVGHLDSASTVTEAMEIFSDVRHPPTIISLDLEMPDGGGLAFLEVMQETRFRPAVIFVSSAGANKLDQAMEDAKEMGYRVLGSLEKPIIPKKLIKVMDQY